MSNCINGSQKLKEALEAFQETTPAAQPIGKRSIEAPCPMRFATLHRVAKSMLRSREAIKALVDSKVEWKAATDTCKNAEDDVAVPAMSHGRGRVWDFWGHLEALVDLVNVVEVGITTMEADAPLLSKLRDMWLDWVARAESWADKRPSLLVAGVVEAFNDRYAKHSDATWAAAYLLDPTHFLQGAAPGVYNVPIVKLDTEELEAALDVLRRLAPLGHDAKALDSELARLQLEPLPPMMARLVPYYHQSTPPTYTSVINLWANTGKAAFPLVSHAAVRLLSMHTTSCASERNWSIWGSLYNKSRNRLALRRAEKLVFIRGNKGVTGTTLPDVSEDDLQLLEGK